ncbi:L-threonine 3-O-phosphate decarboxylase [hydrothermal vent metagenome]|uniref:threonine-phosphate decarboxylase n=1 Tax=hydrothermal vent metagenome TaxID=652676 RepID=A0A3B0ZEN0_9ZZZZ
MSNTVNSGALLHHGGRLRQAALRYGIPLTDWLDLSTGINANGWPVADIPATVWNRLPEDDDGLELAACDYYGAEQLLPVAGSQAAIQALPKLRAPCRVGILSPGYAEHAHAWRSAGHHVIPIAAEQISDHINDVDVLLLIHPNNPTGACFTLKQQLQWHKQLATRSGWLIIDEAFMDATPEQSLAPYSNRDGLIVLRSLGKFFGLAGARVGFVCATVPLLAQLHALLGPWTVNAPARYIAQAALRDKNWQQQTRERLLIEAKRLHTLLTQHGLRPNGGCLLFQWRQTTKARCLHDDLAQQAIFTRLFDTSSSLRFGLPGNESGWHRLHSALANGNV